MADEETKEDDGLFDAVALANESQVLAEIWTRQFAPTGTRRITVAGAESRFSLLQRRCGSIEKTG